ncbi:OmpA family protein [Terrimonas sp. NA20]|uniref:OmpA family protein n=1 Tax=Terrimonas ginsenosidimutans TaxID=2908004 RepID=A0ABS9KY37_9BACT|nr:OmpA family protein [Terrimonas ginsenosidimutans]MCG2617262.1 OmpA family protein [Terrimonas ginsenosidimutans]
MRMSCFLWMMLLARNAISQNLLANGGMEDINICTEYTKECAPEAWMSSASGFVNFFRDAKRAHSGLNCMAIEAAHFQKKYNRTFLRSRLICGLRKGSKYQLEFYVKSIHPILDSVGILFTASDPFLGKAYMSERKPDLLLGAAVQKNAFTDTAWHRVKLIYEAKGNEAYFLVGYFARNDYKGERLKELENQYFIFVDDFSLVPLDPNEHLCSDWKQAVEDIYGEDERHELLEKKRKYYRNIPPPVPELQRNTYTVIDTLILPDILFESGKAKLQQVSFAVLDSIAKRVAGKTVDSLVLKGHTDNTGTPAFNADLSISRARVVADYIAPRISTRRIPVFVYGLSDQQPVADNRQPAGRQKNRRVEILVYVREQ